MVKLLVTSDWQLDMLGGNLNPSARDYLKEVRISTVEEILKIAKEEKVDAILAAGDLFEYSKPTPKTIEDVAKILQRYRSIPIHAIPGNHDLWGSNSVWNTPEFKAIKHFNLHKEQKCIEISKNTFLYCIPVLSKFSTQPQDELLEDVNKKDGIHIVMAHAHDVSYMDFSSHEDDCKLPINSTKVRNKGYDLVVMGHWHSWLEIEENRVLYTGTHEKTKFGEKDAGYIAIIDIQDAHSQPNIIKKKVGQIEWSIEDFDCTGKQFPEELIEFTRGISEDVDFLKIKLTGEVPIEDKANGILQAKQACATFVRHLNIDDKDLKTSIDIDKMTKNVDLPIGLKEIQAAILSELNASDNTELSKKLLGELEVLYRACREMGIIGGSK